MTESDLEAVQRVTDMHAVYRMYSAAGRLLYVGMTGNLSSRLASHVEKRWFPLVNTIRLEWFLTRSDAEAAEARAIRDEHPQINIAGLPSAVRDARSARLRPVSQPEALGMSPVSLAEAVGMRILHGTLTAARKRSQRDPGHPRPVGKHGTTHLYDVSALYAYTEKRGALA